MKVWVVLFACTVAVAAAGSVPSRAAVHNVECGGGGAYPSIQAAVDAAASGDTIALGACVYNESIEITGKQLVIVGSGAGMTDVRWSGTERSWAHRWGSPRKTAPAVPRNRSPVLPSRHRPGSPRTSDKAGP